MIDQTEANTAANHARSCGSAAVGLRGRTTGLIAALLLLFDNAPIRSKILAGFFAIVAVVVAMGGVQLAAALVVREAHTEIVGVVIPHTQALSMIGSQAFDLGGHVQQMSKAAATERAELRREIVRDLDSFRTTVQGYRDLQLTPEDEIEIRMLDLRGRLIPHAEALIAELGSLMTESAPSAAGTLRAAADSIGARAEAIQELVRTGQHIMVDERELETAFTNTATAILIWTNIVGVIVVIGCAVGGGYLIANRIGRPIQALQRAAVKLGDGDFAALDCESRTADEIGDLTAAFQETTVRLRDSQERLARSERLSALGQIAGSVSHELRNPLGMIRNSSDIIRALASGKGLGVERALDRLDHAVERCRVIVTDILEFTRVSNLDRQLTSIDAWLDGVLDEHEIPAAVTVRRELMAGVASMLDGTRFRQVLVNLVDNAVQAMTEPGWTGMAGRAATLTVRTESAGPHVRLSVADNGPGIPADRLVRIFEPLYTTKAHGVGLGLPTVRKLVEQHGGTIDVESMVGEGTIFTVWLPRSPAAIVAAVDNLAATA